MAQNCSVRAGDANDGQAEQTGGDKGEKAPKQEGEKSKKEPKPQKQESKPQKPPPEPKPEKPREKQPSKVCDAVRLERSLLPVRACHLTSVWSSGTSLHCNALQSRCAGRTEHPAVLSSVLANLGTSLPGTSSTANRIWCSFLGHQQPGLVCRMPVTILQQHSLPPRHCALSGALTCCLLGSTVMCGSSQHTITFTSAHSQASTTNFPSSVMHLARGASHNEENCCHG